MNVLLEANMVSSIAVRLVYTRVVGESKGGFYFCQHRSSRGYHHGKNNCLHECHHAMKNLCMNGSLHCTRINIMLVAK